MSTESPLLKQGGLGLFPSTDCLSVHEHEHEQLLRYLMIYHKKGMKNDYDAHYLRMYFKFTARNELHPVFKTLDYI